VRNVGSLKSEPRTNGKRKTGCFALLCLFLFVCHRMGRGLKLAHTLPYTLYTVRVYYVDWAKYGAIRLSIHQSIICLSS
jgi:hypothetical protein